MIPALFTFVKKKQVEQGIRKRIQKLVFSHYLVFSCENLIFLRNTR